MIMPRLTEKELIEGHRLIRNFKREERKEETIEVKDFKWKELGLVEQLMKLNKETLLKIYNL